MTASTLVSVCRLDGNSLAVAKLLANNGFEGAFAIKGGVEGPNGWKVQPYRIPIYLMLSILKRQSSYSDRHSPSLKFNIVLRFDHDLVAPAICRM